MRKVAGDGVRSCRSLSSGALRARRSCAVRDEEFIGRPIACPECRQLLVLSRDELGNRFGGNRPAGDRYGQTARENGCASRAEALCRKRPLPKTASSHVGGNGCQTADCKGFPPRPPPGSPPLLSAPPFSSWPRWPSDCGGGQCFLPRDRPRRRIIADAPKGTNTQKPVSEPKKEPSQRPVTAPVQAVKAKSSAPNGPKTLVTVVRPLNPPTLGPLPAAAVNAPDRLRSQGQSPASGSVTAERAPLRNPAIASRPVAAAQKQSVGPKVNIAAGLRQRLVRFEQPTPVPLGDLIELFQEMVAVPIRGDKSEIADLDLLLQTPITV